MKIKSAILFFVLFQTFGLYAPPIQTGGGGSTGVQANLITLQGLPDATGNANGNALSNSLIAAQNNYALGTNTTILLSPGFYEMHSNLFQMPPNCVLSGLSAQNTTIDGSYTYHPSQIYRSTAINLSNSCELAYLNFTNALYSVQTLTNVFLLGDSILTGPTSGNYGGSDGGNDGFEAINWTNGSAVFKDCQMGSDWDSFVSGAGMSNTFVFNNCTFIGITVATQHHRASGVGTTDEGSVFGFTNCTFIASNMIATAGASTIAGLFFFGTGNFCCSNSVYLTGCSFQTGTLGTGNQIGPFDIYFEGGCSNNTVYIGPGCNINPNKIFGQNTNGNSIVWLNNGPQPASIIASNMPPTNPVARWDSFLWNSNGAHVFGILSGGKGGTNWSSTNLLY